MNWVFDKDILFEKRALRLFHIQSKSCKVYYKYLDLIKVTPSKINKVEQIPFLPIEFFKSQRILSTDKTVEANIMLAIFLFMKKAFCLRLNTFTD